MFNKKEADKELEMIKKGAEALRAAFEINEELEKRIEELEKRVAESDIIIKLHSEQLKHAVDCFDSNMGIIDSIRKIVDGLEERINKHINESYAHDI